MRSNLQIIRDSYAASDRGNPAGILADLSPDARWTEMAGFPCAGTYVGQQGVMAGVFERLGADWEGYTAETDRFYDAGATIVVTGWYAGRHRGTGKSFRCRFTHIWQLDGGAIVAFEQFTDTLLVAQAMRD